MTGFYRNPTKINGCCLQTSMKKELVAYYFYIFNTCKHFKPQNYRWLPTLNIINAFYINSNSISFMDEAIRIQFFKVLEGDEN